MTRTHSPVPRSLRSLGKYLAVVLCACHSAKAPSPSPATNIDASTPAQTIMLTPAASASAPVLARAVEPPATASTALETIPVAANETLIVSLPMTRPPGQAVTITHPGYCHVG